MSSSKKVLTKAEQNDAATVDFVDAKLTDVVRGVLGVIGRKVTEADKATDKAKGKKKDHLIEVAELSGIVKGEKIDKETRDTFVASVATIANLKGADAKTEWNSLNTYLKALLLREFGLKYSAATGRKGSSDEIEGNLVRPIWNKCILRIETDKDRQEKTDKATKAAEAKAESMGYEKIDTDAPPVDAPHTVNILDLSVSEQQSILDLLLGTNAKKDNIEHARRCLAIWDNVNAPVVTQLSKNEKQNARRRQLRADKKAADELAAAA